MIVNEIAFGLLTFSLFSLMILLYKNIPIIYFSKVGKLNKEVFF